MPLALRRILLRARIAWCDFLAWGLRNRLAELDAWEALERQDAERAVLEARAAEYAETRRRWNAIRPDASRRDVG